ncbi:hypothetical protein HK405_010638, partial [Cladochytrium tenue]
MHRPAARPQRAAGEAAPSPPPPPATVIAVCAGPFHAPVSGYVAAAAAVSVDSLTPDQLRRLWLDIFDADWVPPDAVESHLKPWMMLDVLDDRDL